MAYHANPPDFPRLIGPRDIIPMNNENNLQFMPHLNIIEQ